MKRQIFAVVATIALATSALAHDSASMNAELNASKIPAMQNVTVKSVLVSGLEASLGMKLVEDVLNTASQGVQCAVASRDGKRDQNGNIDVNSPLTAQEYIAFAKRFQKTATCVIQTAEGVAFVFLDYSTAGAVKALVLGGKALHYVGRAGHHIKEESKGGVTKMWRWIIRGTDLVFMAPALPLVAAPAAGVIGGAMIEVLGEAGYTLTIEAAKRLHLVVQTSKGVVKNATYVGTELATFEPFNAATDAISTIAGIFNLAPNVLLAEDDKELLEIVNRAQYSIELKKN
ncbi:MAG: hypothetical protein A4S09_04615 [Proteobacteria bacterium SG_bin7]|nr:MAG: hypothetical protein A4S09_04615 [Proteobacteria bacterium SG_bin7]